MTAVEKRKRERYPLERQPRGELFLRTAGGRLPVVAVRDISDNGISVLLNGSIPTDLQVTIEYVEPNLSLQVFGTVVWHAQRPEDHGTAGETCVLGIELLSPMMLAALLQKH